MERAPGRPFIVTGAIVVAYAIAWIGAFALGKHFTDARGFVVWHLAAGLDVSLLLLCGWRFWPAVPLVAALRWAVAGDAFGLPLAFVLVEQTVIGAYYALVVRALTERLRVRFPLARLRDVAIFAAVLVIAAPAIAGLFEVWAVSTHSALATGSFALQYARNLAGVATAMIVLVPAITTLLAWNSYPVRDARRFTIDLVCGALATAAIVAADYAFGSGAGRPLGAFAFLPIGWLAIRCGMRGATAGVVVADVASSALFVALGYPTTALIGYEVFLLSSAIFALAIGVMSEEREALLARVERDAYVDGLTNLPKREPLANWLRQHRGHEVVLAMLDIDDMRSLNEGVGRLAADRLLQDFAERLRSGLGPAYYIARIGSDDFVAATADGRSPERAIEEIGHVLEAPFEVGASRIFIEASLGVVRTTNPEHVDDVLRHADLALANAKESGGRATTYSTELLLSRNPLLSEELHLAFERNEFVPFFQPIFRYDVASRQWVLTGAEALLRWRHPQRGIVAPGEFLDLLERLSICNRVGWQTVEESLRFAARCRSQVAGFAVWVNLFTRQALDPACGRRICELLAATQNEPDALVVEISERTVVSEERDVGALVAELNELGVVAAIDDFGTGGSSLGRLRDLPAKVLKIDRSFVTRSEVDAKAKTVAAAVVRLGAELGMSVLAEGIENAQQIEAMIDVGCEYAQGYAFGHPIPADLFLRTLAPSVA